MRAAVLSMLLIGTVVLIATNARAADLALRMKPAVQAPVSPEAQRRQLFEEFLQFLRERRYR
jgi:hypothetical protein